MNTQIMMFAIGLVVVVILAIALIVAARRSEREKAFDIRALTAAERDRFVAEWKKIEAHFVERPATAVVEADELVTTLMRTRGYPMANFEAHAETLSVKYPRVVEGYRAGHAIIDRHAQGSASTEDLRQAMLQYRALFEDLAGTTTDVVQPVRTVREVEAPRPAGTTVVREEDRPH